MSHVTGIPEGRRATAAYNFVELPGQVAPAESPPPRDREHDRYLEECFTGAIHCELTTASPLYVRSGLTPEQFASFGEKAFNDLSPQEKAIRARFFHVSDPEQPVIPGSSLRGMLRTLAEIASFAKVDRVARRRMAYRAVGDTTSLGESYRPRFLSEVRGRHKHYSFLPRAGYMEQTGAGWRIRPAQVSPDGTTFARIERLSQPARNGLAAWYGCQNAGRLFVDVAPKQFHPHRGGNVHLEYAKVRRYAQQPGAGLREAVYVWSGRMQGKHMEYAFNPPDPAAAAIDIGIQRIEEYREQLTQEQRGLLGDDGVLQRHHPVFYLMKGNDLVFFGHTMMFRLPYPASPYDLVPQNVREPAYIDLAEAIFGYVRGGNNEEDQACAGRVFVEDATVTRAQGALWYKETPITPRILGGPKATSFQLYLTQSSVEKRDLDHYASEPRTTIRGHKLYWHRDENPHIELPPGEEPGDTQLTRIKPVSRGVGFEFDIRFENLTRVELGVLLWVLRLGGDNRYRFKLGMGKSLGMGAVQIQHQVTVSNRRARYSALFEGDDWAAGESEMSATEADECVRAFTSHVLQHCGVQARRIEDIPRIQMLLALFSWPGPPRDRTGMMELSEFRERRVLPLATEVASQGQPTPRPTQQGREKPGGGGRPAPRRVPPPPPPVPEPDPVVDPRLERLKLAIRYYQDRNRRDVPQWVDQIAQTPPSPGRRKLLEELLSKVGRQWAENQPWYPKLQQLLKEPG